jgi:hypothetical protein
MAATLRSKEGVTTMSPKQLSCRRTLVTLLTCLTLVLVALPGGVTRPASAQNCPPGYPPQPQAARSFNDFITRAYLGAYGRTPSCFEMEAAYYNLEQAYYGGYLMAEARRFVATLLITQSAYQGGAYQQTWEYQNRRPFNPYDPHDIYNQPMREAFVADLYRAFLQREPDPGGQCWWQNEVALHGRRTVIHAFEVSIEFEELVNNLFPGDPPNCGPCGGMICPAGYTLDPNTCSCMPPCYYDPWGYGTICY